MASYFSLIIVVLVALFGSSMAGIVPAAIAAPAPLIAAAPAPLVAAAPAPLVAAAAPVFGYAKAVPQNIPPHASRIDVNTRTLAAPYVAAAPYIAPAAPYVAAPAVAAPYLAAPARLAYSPYAAPAGLVETAYAGNFAAPILG